MTIKRRLDRLEQLQAPTASDDAFADWRAAADAYREALADGDDPPDIPIRPGCALTPSEVRARALAELYAVDVMDGGRAEGEYLPQMTDADRQRGDDELRMFREIESWVAGAETAAGE